MCWFNTNGCFNFIFIILPSSPLWIISCSSHRINQIQVIVCIDVVVLQCWNDCWATFTLKIRYNQHLFLLNVWPMKQRIHASSWNFCVLMFSKHEEGTIKTVWTEKMTSFVVVWKSEWVAASIRYVQHTYKQNWKRWHNRLIVLSLTVETIICDTPTTNVVKKKGKKRKMN